MFIHFTTIKGIKCAVLNLSNLIRNYKPVITTAFIIIIEICSATVLIAI